MRLEGLEKQLGSYSKRRLLPEGACCAPAKAKAEKCRALLAAAAWYACEDACQQGGTVQVGPIYDDELAKQLVRPLPEGARLHCFVDACKGVFALGLPSRTYTRADGWSAWEVSSSLPYKALLGQRAALSCGR